MRAASGVELCVRLHVPAPPEIVWAELSHIERHAAWMRDAASIRFVTDKRQGAGTVFVCDTRVGPLRVKDRMEVVEWSPLRALAVRHAGAVRGEGRFELEPVAGGTVVTWVEHLRFPWWLGGPLGVRMARPVLRSIWRSNLRRLAELVAHGRAP